MQPLWDWQRDNPKIPDEEKRHKEADLQELQGADRKTTEKLEQHSKNRDKKYAVLEVKPSSWGGRPVFIHPGKSGESQHIPGETKY